MKKTFSKSNALKEIEDFFSDIKKKTPEEIKKIKKVAMKYKIKLGDKRKLFCKKCFSPYVKPSISIKNDFVNITCENCEYKNRWKLKDDINFGIHYHENETGCC